MEPQPWWIAIAGAIVAALAGAVGKLWAELSAERRTHGAQLDAVRRECDARLEAAHARLEEANDEIVKLQHDAAREHRRDLRTMAGLPASLNPPSEPGSSWPPPIIREAPPRPARKPKKPG